MYSYKMMPSIPVKLLAEQLQTYSNLNSYPLCFIRRNKNYIIQHTRLPE